MQCNGGGGRFRARRSSGTAARRRRWRASGGAAQPKHFSVGRGCARCGRWRLCALPDQIRLPGRNRRLLGPREAALQGYTWWQLHCAALQRDPAPAQQVAGRRCCALLAARCSLHTARRPRSRRPRSRRHAATPQAAPAPASLSPGPPATTYAPRPCAATCPACRRRRRSRGCARARPRSCQRARSTRSSAAARCASCSRF